MAHQDEGRLNGPVRAFKRTFADATGVTTIAAGIGANLTEGPRPEDVRLIVISNAEGLERPIPPMTAAHGSRGTCQSQECGTDRRPYAANPCLTSGGPKAAVPWKSPPCPAGQRSPRITISAQLTWEREKHENRIPAQNRESPQTDSAPQIPA